MEYAHLMTTGEVPFITMSYNTTMDKEVKKIIFLGIVAILVLLVFIIIMLGPRNNSEERHATFPDSTVVTGEDVPRIGSAEVTPADFSTETIVAPTESVIEPFINMETDNWQDTIITSERTTQVEYNPSVTTSNTGLNAATGNTFSRNDLIEGGVMTDDLYVPRNRFFPLSEPIIADETNLLLFPPVEIEPETLTVTRFRSCGNVSLGSSETAVQRYLSNMANTSEASCLGQAVANNCESSRVNVSALSGAVSGSVYVTERNDGVCAVGVYVDGDDVLTLCSVTDSLNLSLLPDSQKTFIEWQAVFAKEPGKTFASLISDDVLDIVNQVSCIRYRL